MAVRLLSQESNSTPWVQDSKDLYEHKDEDSGSVKRKDSAICPWAHARGYTDIKNNVLDDADCPQPSSSTLAPFPSLLSSEATLNPSTSQLREAKGSFPIFSRLPLNLDNYATHLNIHDSKLTTSYEYESTSISTNESYIHPDPNKYIPGTLPYKPQTAGVTYTHSHLPNLDPADLAFWTAAHALWPLHADYGTIAFHAQRTHQKQHQHPVDKPASTCPFTPSSSPLRDIAKPTEDTIALIRSLFHWSDIELPTSVTKPFYGVVFRSARHVSSPSPSTSRPLPLTTPDTNTISSRLYKADRLAHEEAVASGGLLLYFYGVPDPHTGVNLATCIWSSREAAVAASRLPRHWEAVKLAGEAYSWFEVGRYGVWRGVGGLEVGEWGGERKGV